MPALTRGAASELRRLQATGDPVRATRRAKSKGEKETEGSERIGRVGAVEEVEEEVEDFEEKAVSANVGVRPTETTLNGLRAPVTSLQELVWERRVVDVYSGQTRTSTLSPQVDHVVEIQLVEHAMLSHAHKSGGIHNGVSITQHCIASLLRDVVNGVDNLNVTSKRINQAKRGPFTAALRRLRSDRLRDTTLHELARMGRNAWMVDDGTWARIECQMRLSHERLEASAALSDRTDCGARGARDAVVELGDLLSRLGVE